MLHNRTRKTMFSSHSSIDIYSLENQLFRQFYIRKMILCSCELTLYQ